MKEEKEDKRNFFWVKNFTTGEEKTTTLIPSCGHMSRSLINYLSTGFLWVPLSLRFTSLSLFLSFSLFSPLSFFLSLSLVIFWLIFCDLKALRISFFHSMNQREERERERRRRKLRRRRREMKEKKKFQRERERERNLRRSKRRERDEEKFQSLTQ